jgi:hypothetical protein
MITRKDYMDGRATHADYYRGVYQDAHISYVGSALLPVIKAALEKGDEHLNTIPLGLWDARSELNKAPA